VVVTSLINDRMLTTATCVIQEAIASTANVVDTGGGAGGAIAGAVQGARKDMNRKKNALSVGIAVGLFTNDSQAQVEGGAEIDAGKTFTLDAKTVIPFPLRGDFSDVGRGLYTILVDKLKSDFGVQDTFFNSWSQAAADGVDNAMSFSANVFLLDGTTRAVVGGGARINQDVSYRSANQNVTVTAGSTVETVNLSGVVRFFVKKFKDNAAALNPFDFNDNMFGTTSDKSGKGGSLLALQYKTTTEALIGSGVELYANNLTVDAQTTTRAINFIVAGSKGAETAAAGTLSIFLVDNFTNASIADGAQIVTAGNIDVKARDYILAIPIAGGAADSENTGYGVTIALNLVRRNTSAYIGLHESETTGTTPTVISAGGNLTVRAENTGFNNNFALAAAFATPAKPGDEVEPAAGVDAPEQRTPAKTGAGYAGAVLVNVTLDTTAAYINDVHRATPQITAQTVTVEAHNDTTTIAWAGGLAIVTSGTSSSTGVAGALSGVAVVSTTRAFVANTHLAATHLYVDAYRGGLINTITAGGAGAGRPDNQSSAKAGSVSVNIVLSETVPTSRAPRWC
jgi:hypothetical protein